jgi:hypothetical protein
MTPNAFRRVPLRVTRQLDYPEFSCRPIPARDLHAIYTQEPWTYPETYQREVVDTGEWLNRPKRSQKAVTIFCLAVASCAVVYFAAELLRWWLS